MIIATNISKAFKQGAKTVSAVKDVNLEITRGERVYIHGPSGAGKSTLLNMLGGLSSPTEGTIKFNGEDLYNLAEKKRSRLRNVCFGFIFQFYHLLPELSVLENVMLPAMIKGADTIGTIAPRAKRLLETVDMTGRLEHKPSQLSGGEAQRTAIARALVNSPQVLFCDEPTGNLDSKMTEEVYELLKDLSQTNSMSVVVVSHEEVCKDFFHTEYVMRDGILEKRETRDEGRGTRDEGRRETREDSECRLRSI